MMKINFDYGLLYRSPTSTKDVHVFFIKHWCSFWNLMVKFSFGGVLWKDSFFLPSDIFILQFLRESKKNLVPEWILGAASRIFIVHLVKTWTVFHFSFSGRNFLGDLFPIIKPDFDIKKYLLSLTLVAIRRTSKQLHSYAK